MTDPSALRGVVRRIAGAELPGTAQGPPASVPSEQWRSLLERVVLERLSGFAVEAARGGWLALTDEQYGELLDRHRDAMAWTITIEQTLLEVAESLEDRDIHPVVLKGVAVAHTLYPDPSWRAFRDLDILVRPGQWRAACSALEARGVERRFPEPRPRFDERFSKAAVYKDHRGVEIDLHRTLALGPFARRIDTEELFAGARTLHVGGRSLRRPDDTALLLHACIHASLGWAPPELLSLRDVAQLATCGEVDWSRFERLVDRWRIRAVIGHAFTSAVEAFGPILPPTAGPFIEARIPARERRALSAYTTDRRWRGGAVRTTMLSLPGVRAKAAYLYALVFPRREYVRAKWGDARRAPYWRRWTVPLRWMRRPERRS